MTKQDESKQTEQKTKKNENEARRTVIEDLFYDFNRSRAQVYRMNFFRGVFFGFGSLLGGTILVAILAWLLSALGQYIPILRDTFDAIGQLLNR